MKKFLGMLAIVALAAGSTTLALAGALPGTGVNGSPHDMNLKGSQPDAMGRVCVYCHTPHNTTLDDMDTDAYPLWNHTLPETTDWQSYVWATPLNAGLAQDPLIGPSRLCMSCHDGVIAIDQHGPAVAQEGTNPLSGDKSIGGGTQDLTNDHPIGFSWDAAMQARNVNAGRPEIASKIDKFATGVAASGTVGQYDDLTRGGNRKIEDVLYNGDTMTCASCHDVHNKDNVAPSVNNNGIQNNYFLWADQKDSLICISCHYK